MTLVGETHATANIVLPDATTLRITWAAVTHPGLRREANEDSCVAVPPVFAVADGMGGHAAGDVASAAVVRSLGVLHGRVAVGTADLDRALEDAVADLAVSGAGIESGSGTTVTGVALSVLAGAPMWIVFNIGDSRVYRFEQRRLEQLTLDHSVVQELVDAGKLSPEEAEVHPHANVITRAVGFHEPPAPDYTLLPVRVGSRLLLCSDGLSKELTAYGIRHFLGEHATVDEAAHALLDAALDNGGRDNITLIVLDVVEVTAGSSESP